MTLIKAEPGFPMPEKQRGGNIKYPLATMAVGESFHVPKDKISTVRNSVSVYQKRNIETARKFSIRRYEMDYRCWRIA